ncbi:peptidoglycan-binding domain-containing protein [Cellulomonas fimi]|uniref:Peptidoglycan-binding domain 1 protein n=1 Tax=Cellulomonas fimi (strain ATCC 484 / DSM 20113 / JCM 1341 / CCUG 24087 / LMG 16345 / NBRC 15513 / NCIMB 8980 / NCTC 7547 / NRS-133) TaxID=590998 RepID=F4H8J3_CELFA|nr:peptidoglycan-binding domain-containing protein [Cellulomonas fimi]AEE45874.1 Peptidoglycan-binding domain 1 protein [Cellulomonas fimi ATCC 484]NNH06800.1 peptidoglycan-binding protein [Cellulomonas fimi]VEH30856.1 Polar organelle development protein [Cellulomonas fimi]
MRTSTGLRALVVAAVAALVAACGQDTPSALERARADVSAKERALQDAEAASQEANATFCASAAGYVDALDRYGDLLVSTAPTVGDVATAGDDLRQPRADVADDADAAQDAHAAVLDAQAALAQAQAALTELEASATASGAPVEPAEPPEVTATPLAPADAVERVRQADAELTAVQQQIDDDTPLREASERFNAAAVALEAAWLQLYAATGCLTDAEQAAAHDVVAARTSTLQESLSATGHYTGTIDGIYGPATVAAVESLQSAHGLPVTGTVDRATDAALRSELAAQGDAAASSAVASTAALQQTLHLFGYWDGPVDGQWSDALTQALVTFQTDLGVPATGAVDAATVAAVQAAVAASLAANTPSAPEVSATS